MMVAFVKVLNGMIGTCVLFTSHLYRMYLLIDSFYESLRVQILPHVYDWQKSSSLLAR
jgi:hypothetical protein